MTHALAIFIAGFVTAMIWDGIKYAFNIGHEHHWVYNRIEYSNITTRECIDCSRGELSTGTKRPNGTQIWVRYDT